MLERKKKVFCLRLEDMSGISPARRALLAQYRAAGKSKAARGPELCSSPPRPRAAERHSGSRPQPAPGPRKHTRPAGTGLAAGQVLQLLTTRLGRLFKRERKKKGGKKPGPDSSRVAK